MLEQEMLSNFVNETNQFVKLTNAIAEAVQAQN